MQIVKISRSTMLWEQVGVVAVTLSVYFISRDVFHANGETASMIVGFVLLLFLSAAGVFFKEKPEQEPEDGFQPFAVAFGTVLITFFISSGNIYTLIPGAIVGILLVSGIIALCENNDNRYSDLPKWLVATSHMGEIALIFLPMYLRG